MIEFSSGFAKCVLCSHLSQDFINGSGKCLDDNKAPAFSRNNGHIYDDLETCCKPSSWTTCLFVDSLKFFRLAGKEHYDYTDEAFFNCMVHEHSGSGLWFVDYRLERCVKDCRPDETGRPACAMDPPDRYAEVFGDPESCCSQKFQWIPTDQCMDRSYVGVKMTAEVPSNAAPEENSTSASTLTSKWYPSMDEAYKCKRDTPPAWMIENGYQDLYIFESKEACCAVYWC